MRRLLTISIAAVALAAAMPVAAQPEQQADAGEASTAKLDQVAGMMAGLFQTEPLDAAQEARLPAAQAVVGQMMPEGFYGAMMRDTMDKMMRPMMSAFAQPAFVLGVRLGIEEEAIDALSDAEQVELVEMLDPAYDVRIDTIVEVLVGKMGGMFEVMEEPMREGLSKAYAVRFDDAQLADIDAFFHTPTGSIYAKESMALFADPQVMQASMKALPAIMSGFGDLDGAMTEAMKALPAERAYEDLTPPERARMAEVLDVAPADLATKVKPPKAMDGIESDESL